MAEENKWNSEISDQEFEAGRIFNLANRPNQPAAYGVGGLSANDLKMWFDRSAILLKNKLNELIRVVGGEQFAKEIKISLGGEIDEVLGENKINNIFDLVDAITDGTFVRSILMLRGEDGKVLSLQSAIEKIYLALDTMIASTLDGDDEDKAPSVKAVNDGLKGKIDKSAIVENIDGTSSNLVLSQRGLFKCFIPRPSDDLGLQGGAVEGVYARNESEGKEKGYERLIPVNRGNAAGNIPYMSAVASYGQSDGGGYLNTSDPEYPFNCANKRYVDSMKLVVSMSETDYKLTVSLLNYYGQVLSSKVIDLPLETTVSKAEVSEDGTTLTITFRNGSVVSFDVSALAKGLITKEEADRTYAPKKYVDEELAKKQDDIGFVIVNNEICMMSQEDE